MRIRKPPIDILPLCHVEREHIQRCLRLLGYNYTVSAKLLGISRSTLWRKIKEFRIKTPKL